MLTESLYLRECSSKYDRLPAYKDHGSVVDDSGSRRFMVMQYVNKSLNDYVAEKYPQQGDLLFSNISRQMIECIE